MLRAVASNVFVSIPFSSILEESILQSNPPVWLTRPSLAGIMAALDRGAQALLELREDGNERSTYRCIMGFPRPEHDTRRTIVPRPVLPCVAVQGGRQAACFDPALSRAKASWVYANQQASGSRRRTLALSLVLPF